VEETVSKRRTSRLLLPLAVTPRKPKVRQLALTSQRLLCLKFYKGNRGIGVKFEFGLRPSEKEREKERSPLLCWGALLSGQLRAKSLLSGCCVFDAETDEIGLGLLETFFAAN